MIETFSDAARDVLQDRILPLILARVGQAVVDPDGWGIVELVVVGLFTQIGLEVYRHGVPQVFSRWKHLPARGKPLEVLELRDRQCIAFSQIAIVVMTFHYLQYMASSPHVIWRPEQISVWNTLLPLPLFFLVYDAFYAPFHRALHHRSIYAYVHKHHHRQVVPTRGNTDAINVHPFEFLVGEYNHVLTIFLVTRYVLAAHALSCLLFVVLGGCLATLNHTRLDVSALHLPGTRIPIFGVRAHDTHHAIPNSNYGQYIMFWDWVMGTFRLHPQDPGSAESLREERARAEAALAELRRLTPEQEAAAAPAAAKAQ